jgi:hypothetical protein
MIGIGQKSPFGMLTRTSQSRHDRRHRSSPAGSERASDGPLKPVVIGEKSSLQPRSADAGSPDQLRSGRAGCGASSPGCQAHIHLLAGGAPDRSAGRRLPDRRRDATDPGCCCSCRATEPMPAPGFTSRARPLAGTLKRGIEKLLVIGVNQVQQQRQPQRNQATRIVAEAASTKPCPHAQPRFPGSGNGLQPFPSPIGQGRE